MVRFKGHLKKGSHTHEMRKKMEGYETFVFKSIFPEHDPKGYIYGIKNKEQKMENVIISMLHV